MLLQDALQDSTTKFRDKIKEFNTEITQKTVAFIGFVQEQCLIFHEQLKAQAMVEQAAFMVQFEGENDNDIPD